MLTPTCDMGDLEHASRRPSLKRYRSHPMMLIGDQPQSYPSYRDIAASIATFAGLRCDG
jgi:hypothetical protein